MRKISAILKATIKVSVAYKFEFLMWGLLIPLFILMQYFLWNAIFTNSASDVIKGFTFQGIVLYYIMILVTQIISNTYIDNHIAQGVREGSVIKYFTRPISLMFYKFCNSVGERILTIPFFLVPSLIMTHFLVGFATTPQNVVLYLIAAVLSNILIYCFTFVFGMLSFWVEDYSGIRKMKNLIIGIFGGAIVPLVFFPETLQTVFNYLPFQYFLYVPVQMFLGQLTGTQVVQAFIMQIFWIVVLLVAAKLMQERAFAKFTAVGT